MTREEALQAIMLLSALESWSYSTKEHVPDYLHENLNAMIGVLSKIILEPKE